MSGVYEDCVGGPLKLKGASTSGRVKKKKKKKNKAKEILEAVEKKTETTSGSTKSKKTPAELAFIRTQEKRQAQRILEKAEKTHKQRVEEFNSNLDALSEHYDIPKVSWTK